VRVPQLHQLNYSTSFVATLAHLLFFLYVATVMSMEAAAHSFITNIPACSVCYSFF
jgi:hypothetical protein